MQSKDKPYVLFVAEVIYLEISEIKKRTQIFQIKRLSMLLLATGLIKILVVENFHDDWLKELEKNKFIDLKTNKKIPEETIKTIKNSKRCNGKTTHPDFQIFMILKIIYHLRYPKEHLIIFGECVKVMSYGAKRLNKMNLFN